MSDEYGDKGDTKGRPQGRQTGNEPQSDQGVRPHPEGHSEHGSGNVIRQDDRVVDGAGDAQDIGGQSGTLIGSSYWRGATPSPEDMAGFKAVDPTFPERIMRLSEESVRAQNKAMLRSSTLESWSVFIVSVSISVLPWAVCIAGVLLGNDLVAVISGVTGFLMAGSHVINSIKGKDN